MNAAEREAWYERYTALVQFSPTKTTIWTVEGGMTEGRTPEEAILRMQETMGSVRPRLSLAEAERRVSAAVEELEASIDRIDQTPSKHDEERQAYLRVTLMSFLRQQNTIVEDA